MEKANNFNFKDKIINGKSEDKEKLIISFNNLVLCIKKYSPYEILSHINTFFKMTLLNVKTEYHLGEDSMELKYTLELVQMIMSCIPINEYKNEKMEEKDIYEIINLGNDIFELKTIISFAYTFEMFDEESDKAQYIFESITGTEITGKRYDIFEIQHYKDLFIPLKDYFENTYKFQIDMFFSGIDKLKKKFMFGLNDSQSKMRVLMDNIDINNLTDLDKEIFANTLDEVFGLKLQNVSEITGWPNTFVDLFTYNLGDNIFSLENITFEKILDLHKNINKKPVIKIDDNYFYLVISRLLDNLDRIVLKDLYKQNKKLIKEVADTCENLVGNYIKEIINDADILTSNFYKSDGKMCENDVLIFFDNYLLIIEVKSGSFTPDVALNNFASHLISLKKLVEEASSQTNRFYETLKNNQTLDIFNSNNKNSKKKCTINLNDYKEIFKIVVTLEGFNEIEARADKIGILDLSKDIIVCSLDDLKVYSDYFKNNPTQFLHYMTYRRMATNTKGIELFDELDHLGLYIEHNCYPVTADNLMEEPINHILWESPREDLDLYYNGKYIGGDWIVDKPIQKIPYRLSEMIDFVNHNLIFKNVSSISYLLDLSGNQKEELFKNIEMFINYYINSGKIKYAFVRNHFNNLVFLSCIVNNNDFDESIVFDDIYANMKITNSEEANVLFLYYDGNKKLVNITYTLLTSKDEKFSSEKIDEIVEMIKIKRFEKRNYSNKKNKIGRNELCPCGSGIKYKKCCGK